MKIFIILLLSLLTASIFWACKSESQSSADKSPSALKVPATPLDSAAIQALAKGRGISIRPLNPDQLNHLKNKQPDQLKIFVYADCSDTAAWNWLVELEQMHHTLKTQVEMYCVCTSIAADAKRIQSINVSIRANAITAPVYYLENSAVFIPTPMVELIHQKNNIALKYQQNFTTEELFAILQPMLL